MNFNFSLIGLELCVVALGLIILLADLWLPAERKRMLGYLAAGGLGLLLVFSLAGCGVCSQHGIAFNGMFIQDGLSLFFKRFFLLAAILVLVMAAEFSDRIASGISEYYSLILFALSGMLFAASANNFAVLFVSLELITITFYILTSFQRARAVSLEAGVKYLIIGALSTAFTVFGIALIYGISGQFSFSGLAEVSGRHAGNGVFLFGLLFLLAGLGFKIAAFPFQIWAPDVYQGSPTPTTAFLAIGSKAAGFVLLLRVLFTAVPEVTAQWTNLLIGMSAVTILYGNLCAIPQRNIKRLLGYSSIAHAGYLLLGVAAISAAGGAGAGHAEAGGAAILYYLFGYLFTVLGGFMVIAVVLRQLDTEDIGGLAGLNQRSPFLAAAMTVSMVSLAGIPPLAGFFGKFLLLKAALAQGEANPGFYCLTFVAIAGVVVSIYYYFGVVRAIYWSPGAAESTPVAISLPARASIVICIAGVFWLGLFPSAMVTWANAAAKFLQM